MVTYIQPRPIPHLILRGVIGLVALAPRIVPWRCQPQLLVPTRRFHKVSSACDWEPGELIAYRLLSGSFVFQVIDHHKDAGGVAPNCEIFDWEGRELPPPSTFEGLPMRAQIPFMPMKSTATAQARPLGPPRYRLMIGQASKREFATKRVIRMNAKVTIQHPPKSRNVPNPTLVSLWRWLDRDLERHYGFR